MKKLFLFSILIIVATTIPACGKKERNLYLNESEIETEMPSDSVHREEVAAKPKIVVARPSSETSSRSETEPSSEPQVATEVTPKTSDNAPATQISPETSASDTSQEEAKSTSGSTSGITFNDDGSVTVSQEILSKLAEEEKGLIAALGLTDEQIEILTTNGDLTLSPELQNKLLKFLDTLSFTEKLRLLGKLATLLEE